LEAIEALDRPFDPRVHEALAVVPAPDRAPGTVVVELRKGYRMRDRILRPARVHVAAAPPPADPQVKSEEAR
ncbi:MAG: nucleotide exchange factor GrpE, partial [Planctomycetota bacterium]